LIAFNQTGNELLSVRTGIWMAVRLVEVAWVVGKPFMVIISDS